MMAALQLDAVWLCFYNATWTSLEITFNSGQIEASYHYQAALALLTYETYNASEGLPKISPLVAEYKSMV